MKTIWKYTIQMKESQFVVMPACPRILSVQLQHGQLVMWALVDPSGAKGSCDYSDCGYRSRNG
jgi:hypothetical protein